MKSILLATALAVAVAAPASALEVTKSTMIEASPAAVWKMIGGF